MSFSIPHVDVAFDARGAKPGVRAQVKTDKFDLDLAVPVKPGDTMRLGTMTLLLLDRSGDLIVEMDTATGDEPAKRTTQRFRRG